MQLRIKLILPSLRDYHKFQLELFNWQSGAETNVKEVSTTERKLLTTIKKLNSCIENAIRNANSDFGNSCIENAITKIRTLSCWHALVSEAVFFIMILLFQPKLPLLDWFYFVHTTDNNSQLRSIKSQARSTSTWIQQFIVK